MEQCASRELQEESGLIAEASSLKRMGYLVFKMIEAKKILRVHVYESWNFNGVPSETDEMSPRWFNQDDVPLHQMWPDDKYWLPLLLEGKTFIGRFDYSGEDTIESYDVSITN